MSRSVAARIPSVEPAALGLELRLLGAPCLVVGGRRLALSAKDAALLCLVALAGPIRADRAATMLWPAVGAKQADTSLRQRLYRLRRDAGLPLLGGGTGLQLLATVQTDLAQALERIDRDEHAALEELLGDLDFDALPELAEWLRQQRRQWQEKCAAALAAAAARCEAEGAVARGLVYAQRLVESDPLAEHGQRRLMRLHYLRGDRAAAIAAFERFEQRLKDELGTRPSAETIELLADDRARRQLRCPVRRTTAPASLLRPPRLIGRERELQALGACLGEPARIHAGRRGRHRQEPPAAGVLRRPARASSPSRRGPGDAGIAYAVLAALLRSVLAAHPH
jgi:DNA-binding SARP family transcriptional activator